MPAAVLLVDLETIHRKKKCYILEFFKIYFCNEI